MRLKRMLKPRIKLQATLGLKQGSATLSIKPPIIKAIKFRKRLY